MNQLIRVSLDVFTNCKKFSIFFLLRSIKGSLTGMEWDKLIILMENAVIPWKILSSLRCQQCSLPVSSSPWPWEGIVGIKYYVGNSATFWWCSKINALKMLVPTVHLVLPPSSSICRTGQSCILPFRWRGWWRSCSTIGPSSHLCHIFYLDEHKYTQMSLRIRQRMCWDSL